MSENKAVKSYSDLPTVDLPGIEIFSEGSWNGDKYSGEDLQAMIDAFGEVGFEPTVKAGHADGQDNLNEKEYRKIFGAPALGYVSRIYRKGVKLVADLKRVPRNFANLIKAGAYKRVSSEIYWNYADEANGKKHPRVLKSIAFLGAEIPALPNLKAIEALFHKNGESVYAYEGGREFRMYEMDKMDKMKDSKEMPADGVMEKDGKWCAYKAGKLVGEYSSQVEAMAAMSGNESDEKEAKPPAKGEVPPQFNKEKYQDTKGDIHMTEAEVQAKLDELKADLTKEYDAKTADQVAKVKADAEGEKKALADRVAQLEKQNQDALAYARNTALDARVEKLFEAGKLATTEKDLLKSVARALPEMATHSYAAADGSEVKEAVIDTVFKLFENRKVSLFNEVSQQGREIKSYSDAQNEVVKRANDLIAKSDGKIDMVRAYQQVRKDDPELWRQYQSDVSGKAH